MNVDFFRISATSLPDDCDERPLIVILRNVNIRRKLQLAQIVME